MGASVLGNDVDFLLVGARSEQGFADPLQLPSRVGQIEASQVARVVEDRVKAHDSESWPQQLLSP